MSGNRYVGTTCDGSDFSARFVIVLELQYQVVPDGTGVRYTVCDTLVVTVFMERYDGVQSVGKVWTSGGIVNRINWGI
jgi:hypothetical protein